MTTGYLVGDAGDIQPQRYGLQSGRPNGTIDALVASWNAQRQQPQQLQPTTPPFSSPSVQDPTNALGVDRSRVTATDIENIFTARRNANVGVNSDSWNHANGSQTQSGILASPAGSKSMDAWLQKQLNR